MIQYTIAVEGMACSMCEAHVNDAVRKAFPVKKVSSSHSKGQTLVLTEEPLDEETLRQASFRFASDDAEGVFGVAWMEPHSTARKCC